MLSLQMQCDEVNVVSEGTYSEVPQNASEGITGMSYDDDCSVRIANDAAENGYSQEPGPLTWLNSARITADPKDDAVHCVVSVGDPRGGFCFTVRRLTDGRLVIHTPYPGESLSHCRTIHLHDGTLLVVHDGKDNTPIDFSDSDGGEDE